MAQTQRVSRLMVSSGPPDNRAVHLYCGPCETCSLSKIESTLGTLVAQGQSKTSSEATSGTSAATANVARSSGMPVHTAGPAPPPPAVLTAANAVHVVEDATAGTL